MSGRTATVRQRNPCETGDFSRPGASKFQTEQRCASERTIPPGGKRGPAVYDWHLESLPNFQSARADTEFALVLMPPRRGRSTVVKHFHDDPDPPLSIKALAEVRQLAARGRLVLPAFPSHRGGG